MKKDVLATVGKPASRRGGKITSLPDWDLLLHNNHSRVDWLKTTRVTSYCPWFLWVRIHTGHPRGTGLFSFRSGAQLEVWSLAPGIIQRLVYSPTWHLIPAVSWDLNLGCWMETHRHSLTMGPDLPHNTVAVFEKRTRWERGRQKRQQVESYYLIIM